MSDNRNDHQSRGTIIDSIWRLYKTIFGLRKQVPRAGWYACAMVTALNFTVYAQPILIDDFEDEDAIGWNQVWSPGADQYAEAAYDVVSGDYSKEYRLWRVGELPPGRRGFLAALWEDNAGLEINDGYLRARIRTENAPTQVAVYLRLTGALGQGFDGYYFGADTEREGGGGFGIARLDNTGIFYLTDPNPDIVFGPNEYWLLEAGAVGDRFSLKVWKYGESEPAAPQFEATDNTFQDGTIGLSTNATAFPFDTSAKIDARFDDIFFIPFIEGDLDRDGLLTVADINLLLPGHDPPWPNDEVVDGEDRRVWIEDLFGSFLGDTDLNKTVDFADFLALSANFGQQGGWEAGDFDGSGDVQFADFLLLSSNFGKSAAAAAVPEPNAGGLVLIACLGIGGRLRHRIRPKK